MTPAYYTPAQVRELVEAAYRDGYMDAEADNDCGTGSGRFIGNTAFHYAHAVLDD